MPKPIYEIGDRVYCSGLGSAYIASKPHYRPYKNNAGQYAIEQVYLLYFDQPTPHVAYGSLLRYQHAATPDSIACVQSAILDMFKPDTGISDPDTIGIFVGDTIHHYQYGPGIVISDGYYRPEMNDNKVYYHVYFPRDEIFDFQRIFQFTFDNIRTNISRKQAQKILFDKILEPIFSA